MSFLPIADREYLTSKQITYEELHDGGVNWLILRDQPVPPTLLAEIDGKLVRVDTVSVAVEIPSGYNTTKLDSFYTLPKLKRAADGAWPQNCAGERTIQRVNWQFWSRHLETNEWRAAIDGLSVFLQYISVEMKAA